MESYHISDVSIKQLTTAFYNFVKESLLAFKLEENTDITFSLYFMRRIRAEKGIRYIALGNNIVLFTYDKSHPKYNRIDPITQLCRHLMMDLNQYI